MTSNGKLGASKNVNNLVSILIGGLVLFGGAMVFDFWKVSDHSGQSAKYVTKSTELRVLSQRIAKNALESAVGNDQAFAYLDLS